MNRSFQQTTTANPMPPTVPNTIPQPASVSSNNSENRNNDPPAPELEQAAPQVRRREVYRYNANVPLYATSWSHKVYPEKKFRIAAGTCLDLENLTGNKT
uniref:Uncharacterized protein n=1 Tax=Acrobeloides nanus TaxID=290746 RepID=A0A914ENR2_9BILA